MKNVLMILCVAALLSPSVPAQTLDQGQQALPTQTPPNTAPPVSPVAQGRQTPPPGVAVPQGQQGQQGQSAAWNNVKVDVAIVDSGTTNTPTRKVLNIQVADGRQSVMRTQSEAGLINIDVRPQVRPDGRSIVLQLTVEYRQGATGAQFSQSLSAVVIDGKAMVLSQTADANNDRRVSVEVTATIQRN